MIRRAFIGLVGALGLTLRPFVAAAQAPADPPIDSEDQTPEPEPEPVWVVCPVCKESFDANDHWMNDQAAICQTPGCGVCFQPTLAPEPEEDADASEGS